MFYCRPILNNIFFWFRLFPAKAAHYFIHHSPLGSVYSICILVKISVSQMALSFSSPTHLASNSLISQNPRPSLCVWGLSFASDEIPKSSLRITADSIPKARFVARRRESTSVRQLQRPLSKFELEQCLGPNCI